MSNQPARNQQPDSALVEQFESRRRELADHDIAWLREARQQGLARFAERGVPGRKHEQWKYTPTRAIAEGEYWRAAAEAEVAPADLAPFEAGLEANRLVFINGRYAESLSQILDTDAGLMIEDFAGALERRPEWVKQYFDTQPDDNRFPFAAINTGLAEHGAVVSVPDNAEPAHPVHLLFLNTDTGGQFSVHPRILVVGGANSRFDIIEHYGSLKGKPQSMTNVVGELFLGAGAQCRHTKVLEEADSAIHLGATYVSQARDSRFEAHTACLGGALVRNDLNIRLNEPGGECDLHGFYLPRGKEHVDNHTSIEHKAPHCTTREYYKGVIKDRGRAVFNGRIHIYPDAQKTDAQLHNKNMLLSKQGEVDTKPELEIYADDVKCAHGATIGELDPREIYYLESRGIDRRQAETMLSLAFINEIIEQLPYAELRERATTFIEHRMLENSDEQ
jgi:Fe-S cluster assembly protein SufD